MAPAPLPLPVSVSSRFSSVGETLRLRGVEQLSLGGQQGKRQRGGGAGSQDFKPGWCLSLYLHNAMLP